MDSIMSHSHSDVLGTEKKRSPNWPGPLTIPCLLVDTCVGQHQRLPPSACHCSSLSDPSGPLLSIANLVLGTISGSVLDSWA